MDINSAILKSTNAALPQVFAQEVLNMARHESVIGQLNTATPLVLGKNITTFVKDDLGYGFVEEGEDKPYTDLHLDSYEITPKKFAIIVGITEEMRRTDQVGIIPNIKTTMINNYKRQADVGAMYGVDTLNGKVFNSESIVAGANEVVVSNGDYKSALLAAIEATNVNGNRANGVAIDSTATSKVVQVVNETPYGLPDMSTTSFNVAGLKAVSDPVVSLGGTNNVKAIVGDWSKLKYGFVGDIEFRTTKDGSVGGRSAFQSNTIFFLAEGWFGFKVLDPKAFTVIKTAD